MILSKKQMIGIVGTLLTMLGVFLPIFGMDTFDDLTLFSHGKGDGVIILTLSILALILILFRQFIAFLLVTLISSTIIGMVLYKIYHHIHDTKKDAIHALSGNHFAPYFNSIISSAQLKYGWFFLCTGCFIALITVFIQHKKPSAKSKSSNNQTITGRDILETNTSTPPQTSYSETKACPYCAQSIRITAIKCRHCEKMLEEI